VSLKYWSLIKRFHKKITRLVSVLGIILLVYLAVVIFKGLFLHQIKNRIRTSFDYTELRLSTFPPALIMHEVRSLSASPFIAADKVSVSISFRSLFSREKPIDVLIDRPVLRIYAPSTGQSRSGLSTVLPFAVSKVLIRRGDLFYWGDKLRVQSHDVNIMIRSRKEEVDLRLVSEENTFAMADREDVLKGRLSLRLHGNDSEINLDRLRWKGSQGFIKADGLILDLADPEFQIRTRFRFQPDPILGLLNVPFEWEGRAEGRGILSRRDGQINFRTDVFHPNLILNQVPLGNVEGKVEVMGNGGAEMEFSIRNRSRPEERIRISVNKKQVKGTAQGVHLEAVINAIPLPWPVASPAWGTFTVDEERLSVQAEFRDDLDYTVPGKFPFHGEVELKWDGDKDITFSAQNLESSFSRIDLRGHLRVEQEMDIVISGDVKDVAQAREFTSLALSKPFLFPEIRGQGETDIHIFGDSEKPQIKAGLVISPGGFDTLNAQRIEGEAELIGNDFFGRINVDDPLFQGKIGLFTNPEETRVTLQVEKGRVEAILPAFDIQIPIAGEAEGHFEFEQKGLPIRFTGNFSGARMKMAGQLLTDVKGKVAWAEPEGILEFPELAFGWHDGRIDGSLSFRFPEEMFDISIKAKEVDLSLLRKGLRGQLNFLAEGQGRFGDDSVSGNYHIEDFKFDPFQESEVEGTLELAFPKKALRCDITGRFLPGENELAVKLNIPFDQESLEGEVRGFFSDMDLLVPWKGVQGTINYLGEVGGTLGAPHIKGAIDFSGPVLPIPRFAHAVRDYRGLIFVDDGRFSLRSFQGKLGGGDVQGTGVMLIGREGVENINIRVEGKNLLLSPLERTLVLADADLNLIKEEDRFELGGDIQVRRLLFRREFTEKFALASSPYRFQRPPSLFDDLSLNIRVSGEDNAWMENSWGRIRGAMDLTLAGSVRSPVVLGDIEAREGEVYFQDREFKVISGKLSFFNPLEVEPYISFKGETYVKDYRVTFSLDGFVNSLSPEFASSPPLPPEDVLALLALGEAFRRTYHYDRSIGQSTASLLSFQLSEEAQKRAEKLLSIDSIRIDPFILGSSAEMTARLTVGKKISRNFFILYSTNLGTQRAEIMRLEWELTDDLSIVGTRNEMGRISFDVKIHKRF